MFRIIIWSFWLIIGVISAIEIGNFIAIPIIVFLFGPLLWKAINDFRKESDEILTSKIREINNDKQCPHCNSDTVRAYIEDGSYGDWCPSCKQSVQKMSGKLKKDNAILIKIFIVILGFLLLLGLYEIYKLIR